MTEHQEPDPPRSFTVCAQPGCPERVPDTGPEITAQSYCDEHRILFELDTIEGSTEDLIPPE